MPAIIFDRLPEDHVVQMFVTINAKHTRLNASHLVSLSGRQLYRDEALATGHDVVRALNDREDSPLYDEIKLLGVGRGRVAQAPLAQELKKLFADDGVFASRRSGDVHEEAKKFFVNYFKQIALVFGGAWNGRKYSIRSASALRAFIRVAPDVIRRLDQEHADRADFRAIGRVLAPWGRRIGDLRFETEGAWKRGGTTVDLARQGAAARAAVSGGSGGLTAEPASSQRNVALRVSAPSAVSLYAWERCSSPAAPGSSAPTSFATPSTTPPTASSSSTS